MDDVEEKKPVVAENVEYVSEQLEGAALEAFSDVFARFQAHALSSVVRGLHIHPYYTMLDYMLCRR